jgi:uncharacterized membrane protein YphA (DoxX/SURF4 family)
VTTSLSSHSYRSLTSRYGRLATAALWTLQVAIAALLFLDGGSSLVTRPRFASVPMTSALGQALVIAQWFRHAVGTLEVAAAIAVLVPALVPVGALLIVVMMLGAVATQSSLIGGLPAAAPLIGAFVILAARRQQLIDAWSRLR